MGRPVLLGSYELLERLGSSEICDSFKAATADGTGERRLAFLRVMRQDCRDMSTVKAFVNAAKISSMANHPKVVQTWGLGSVNNQFWLATEFVDGISLLPLLARFGHRRWSMAPEIPCFIVSQLCEALQCLHHEVVDFRGNPRCILHRKLRPSSILLSWQGEVKLADLDEVRVCDPGKGVPGIEHGSTPDETGSVQITNLSSPGLAYTAPEQFRGDIDHRADIFQLGVVLFESLTLRRLFLAPTELETLIRVRDCDVDSRLAAHPDLDPDLQAIIKKALAPNPDDRYQTANQFHQDLTQLVQNHSWTFTEKDLSVVLRSSSN